MTDTLSDLIKIKGKPVSVAELANIITDIIRQIPEKKEYSGCWYWTLGNIGSYTFAVVMGWEPGYEDDPDDPLCDENHHLAIKLACQPDNSAMQCDFDVDWEMPYDPETGDVDDTSTAVYISDTTEHIEDTLSSILKTYITYRDNPDGEMRIINIKKGYGVDYVLNFDALEEYIRENFTLDGTCQHMIYTILNYAAAQEGDDEDVLYTLSYLLNDIGISEQEICKVLFKENR